MSKNHAKTKLSIVVGLFAVAITGLVFATLTMLPASAKSLVAENKAILYDAYQCYVNGNVTSQLANDDFHNLESIVSYTGEYYLPTGYYNISSANCFQIFGGDTSILTGDGKHSFTGALALGGLSVPNDGDTAAIDEFLTKLGYEKTTVDGGMCASYRYAHDSGDSVHTIRMCASTNKEGIITSDQVEVTYTDGSAMINTFKVGDHSVDIKCSQLGSNNGCGVHTFTPNETSFETFAGEILRDLQDHRAKALCDPFRWGVCWRLQNKVDIESRGDVKATYSFKGNSASSAASVMLKTLSGGAYSNLFALKLSEAERINMLEDFLLNYYKIERYDNKCNLDPSQIAIAKGAGYVGVVTKMFSSGSYENCYIKPTQNANDSVISYNPETFYIDGTVMSYDEILEVLGKITGDDADETNKAMCNQKALASRSLANSYLSSGWATAEEKKAAQTTIKDLDKILEKTKTKGKPEAEQIYWYEDENTKQIMCYTYTDLDGKTTSGSPSGDGSDTAPDYTTEGDGDTDISACKKATSLGWVFCPLLDIAGKTMLGMYSQMGETWIAIDGNEIDPAQEKGQALYKAWSTFRDAANIGFAILFAVVVFSQVTGIGLSNYSIKKMLPTLIMVAVLVNISFIICQLAVDVTNIVGVDIGKVMETLTQDIKTATAPKSMWEHAGYAASGLLSAAGIAGAGYAAAPVIATSIGGILIAVLLACISAIIGLFFLFILLALRKAFIFAAIMLAPLAIVCYAFPNTKSLFDKWKKLFINLLLVFPICQILVYGGQAMSALMMASDSNSFFFQLTAMLLQIIPIFFIPMVLRNAMSMLGNIGARVAQMGAKVGHTLSGAAGRTQLATRAAVGLNKLGATKFANSRRMQRKYDTGSIGSRLQAGSRARIAGALTKAEDLRQADNRANNIASAGFMDSLEASANIKADEEFGDNYVAGLSNGALLKEDGSKYDMNDLRHEVGGEGENGDMVQLYSKLLSSRNEDDVKRLKGLTKHLLNIKGGKGLAVMAAAMRKRGGAVFDENGALRSVNAKERETFNKIAKYATNNEKWNTMVKRWDPNMTALLNDGAMDSDAKVDDRGDGAWAHYNIGASGNSTASQLINHDDSFFDGLRNVYGTEAGFNALREEGLVGDSLRASLAAYQGHAQEVFDNPRVYSQAGGALRDIQKVSNSSQAYAETLRRLDEEIRENRNRSKFADMRKQVEKEMKDRYEQMGPRTSMRVDHGNGGQGNGRQGNGNAYDADGNNIFE